MEIRENGIRYRNYDNWSKTKQSPYNYDKGGLLKYIISPNIANSKNYITRMILYYYEKSIVYVFKFIDRLKHFKDIHWLNR